MDYNSDGKVSRNEIDTTDVLMPADLTDDTLSAMIEHLKLPDSISARAAVSLLSEPEPLPSASVSVSASVSASAA